MKIYILGLLLTVGATIFPTKIFYALFAISFFVAYKTKFILAPLSYAFITTFLFAFFVYIKQDISLSFNSEFFIGICISLLLNLAICLAGVIAAFGFIKTFKK